MKKTCRLCGEEFEWREGKPGLVDVCLNCVQDPERVERAKGEIRLADGIYVKAGLPIKSKDFSE